MKEIVEEMLAIVRDAMKDEQDRMKREGHRLLERDEVSPDHFMDIMRVRTDAMERRRKMC